MNTTSHTRNHSQSEPIPLSTGNHPHLSDSDLNLIASHRAQAHRWLRTVMHAHHQHARTRNLWPTRLGPQRSRAAGPGCHASCCWQHWRNYSRAHVTMDFACLLHTTCWRKSTTSQRGGQSLGAPQGDWWEKSGVASEAGSAKPRRRPQQPRRPPHLFLSRRSKNGGAQGRFADPRRRSSGRPCRRAREDPSLAAGCSIRKKEMSGTNGIHGSNQPPRPHA